MKLTVSEIGRWLIYAGIMLVIVGAVFLLAGKIPWLGKLPGDIVIKRDNFTFYFPLGTCILISIVLSLILYLFRR
jgi:hypothetical protein